MVMTKEEIGEKLKAARISCGMTQQEVANKIGRKQPIIGHWETGYSQPDANTLFMLCDIFGTTVDEVFGFNKDRPFISSKDKSLLNKYHSLDLHGQQTVNIVLDRELDRTSQAKEATNTIEQLQQQLTLNAVPSRFFAYYGKIAAAGTSVEFSDITAGVRVYPENELNKNADYVIGVSGSSMEPEYSNGDIVYVQKTDYIDTGDMGIFQKGNNIYIKKAGENELISLNPNYPLLTDNGDRIIVLGKVLGKAEEI